MSEFKISKAVIPRSAPVVIAVVSVIVLGILGIAFCLKFMHQAGEDPDTIYNPKGYYERVNNLLKDRLLVYRKSGGLNERGEAIPSWGMLIFDEDKAEQQAPKSLEFYEASSRLQNDIDDFNAEGSGGLFELRGDEIVINKTVHNFNLPYPERNFWQGSLAFRGNDYSVFASEDLVLEFGKNEEKQEAGGQNTVSLNHYDWMASKKKAKYRAINFDLISDVDNKVTARITSINAEQVVIEIQNSQAHVFLNGLPLNKYGPNGEPDPEIIERNKDQKPACYLLKKGDWVRFESKSKNGKIYEKIFTFADTAEGWISRNWIENGQQVNRMDETIAEEIPLLKRLHDCFSSYMTNHPEQAKKIKPVIKVTLDRELHSKLDAALDSEVDYLNGKFNVPKIEWEGAAVTVMDALRGDILALPSYPNTQRLEELEERALLSRKGGMPRVTKNRLSLNQNLRPLAIGSTIKPILASAIWTEYPELMKLKVNEQDLPSKENRYIAGHPVLNFYDRNRGLLDAKDFIKHSSNVYLAELYFLSIANQNSYKIRNGSAVSVGGSRPDLSAVFKGSSIIGGLERERFRAHELAYEAYDIRARKNYLQFDADAFDDHFMGDIFEKLEIDSKDGLPKEFTRLAPLRPVWELGSMAHVRNHLVSWLLGSYHNRWPTVKLAETYSRIGSGKMVKAALVDSTKLSEEKEYDDLPISDDALALLHTGMKAGVSESGGTSYKGMIAAVAAARKSLPPGVELVLLAKTGTPQITNKTKTYPYTQSGVFCLYLECRDKANQEKLAALTIAVNLRKRGTSVNAVIYTAKVMPTLMEWFNAHPKVKKYAQ